MKAILVTYCGCVQIIPNCMGALYFEIPIHGVPRKFLSRPRYKNDCPVRRFKRVFSHGAIGTEEFAVYKETFK